MLQRALETARLLKPLTMDGQNTLVQVGAREVGVSAGQDEQPVQKDTASTSDLTGKKKRNKGLRLWVPEIMHMSSDSEYQKFLSIW